MARSQRNAWDGAGGGAAGAARDSGRASPLPGQVIRARRLAAGLTQDELAQRIGCSKAQLSLMESGQRTVSPQRAARIERTLRLRDKPITAALHWHATPAHVRQSMHQSQTLADDLREALTSSTGSSKSVIEELRRIVERASSNIDPLPLPRRAGGIPVINKVAAGYPAEFTDLDYPASVADEYIACPDVSDPQAFAARVVGDSMEPDYREGDIVVFSPMLDTPGGSDCFVRLERDNETTFKRVYFEEDGRTIRLQPLNNAYAPRFVDREDISGLWAAVYVMRKVERLKVES
jgi:SOS-response transcriptional repressor LexA